MNNFVKPFILNVIFGLLMYSSALAQFTADMIQTQNGQTSTNKLYVEDPFYCFEQIENGEKIFVIIDKNLKVTSVVRPSEKMFIEMKSQSMMSRSNDVFQSIENLKATTNPDLIGKETINGYECEKYSVMRDGQEIMTYWQSTELGFPIKVINTLAGDMTMELKNIHMGDVDDSIFKIPSDYKKMEMPGR